MTSLADEEDDFLEKSSNTTTKAGGGNTAAARDNQRKQVNVMEFAMTLFFNRKYFQLRYYPYIPFRLSYGIRFLVNGTAGTGRVTGEAKSFLHGLIPKEANCVIQDSPQKKA